MKLAFNCQSRAVIITYKLFIKICNCLIDEDEQIFYLDYFRDFDIKQFLNKDIKNEMIEFNILRRIYHKNSVIYLYFV